MKVILPVAGIGTRLRPHTLFLPKALLPVGGSNILGYIIDKLADLAVSEIILVTGYKGELIEEYMAQRKSEGAPLSDVPVRFVEQSNPRGLGEAIHLCTPFLNDEPTLIILGDTLFEANLNKIVQSEKSIICTRVVEDPERFGVVVTNDVGEITALVEKPAEFVSNEAIVGIYWIRESGLLKESLQELLDNDLRTRGEFQLTDGLAKMLKKGVTFRTAKIDDWLDCGKPETLLETNEKLLKGKTHNDSTQLINCKLVAPYYISKNVQMNNCTIGPNASIYSNVKGTDSSISNSVIGAGAQISDSQLENSLVGDHSVVLNYKGSLNIGDHSEIGTL